ncbi:DUF1127 domain-containing protein [Thalassospira sp. HF15]|uniref:DUF1127 domain-containing protein n=1 Tax=Thalassospira sp. HF15 TaxID=2722755 RepID=UPI0014319FBD|nr:DUF1127 domain-containing protein [Thalassospira sp. HF15]NIY77208.1 DUF1127 domain-containing protein [Thalassospira sp. HF15]
MAYSLSPAPSAVERQPKAHVRPFITNIFGRLNDFSNRFARLLAVREERRMLLKMTDAQLSDIGITRAQAEEEYRQSFKLR